MRDTLRRAAAAVLRHARGRTRVLRDAGGAGLLCLALGSTIAFSPRPLLVWNASASAPVGLYALLPGVRVGKGDMVIARLPARYRTLAVRRRYLPPAVPLVKRVAAAGGERVCAHGGSIIVDGRLAARRRRTDGKGRALPWWEGCLRLGGEDLFLLMDNPASFDGRYFGVVERSGVLGRAYPLWTR